MPVKKISKGQLKNQIRSLIINIPCSKRVLVELTVGWKYDYQIQSPTECEKLHSDRDVRKNDK